MYKQFVNSEAKLKRVTSKRLIKLQVHISSFRQLCNRNRTYLLSDTIMHILIFLITLILFKHMCRAYCQQTSTNSLPFKTAINPSPSNVGQNSLTRSINIYYDQKTTLQTNCSSLPEKNIFRRRKKKQSVSDTAENPIIQSDKTFKSNESILTHLEKLDSHYNDNKNNQRYKREPNPSVWNDHNVRKLETNKFMDAEDKQTLLSLVMNGLGIKVLPNMKKINISQTEYISKYNEYLQIIQKRRKLENDQNNIKHRIDFVPEYQIISFSSYNVSKSHTYEAEHKDRKKRGFEKNFKANKHPKDEDIRNQKTTTHLHFSLNSIDIENKSIKTEEVEEANLRLLLIYNPALTKRHPQNKIEKLCNRTSEKNNYYRKHNLNIKIYQRLPRRKRVLIDRKKIDISFNRTNWDNTHSQWIQFDVTQAVREWLTESQLNLDLDLQCDKCEKTGARILSDISSNNKDRLVPVINIITRPGQKATIKNDLLLEKDFNESRKIANSTEVPGSCQFSKSKHPRCCRHSMQVVFSQIKGFEFIIQPKTFDAGYCFGRCPIRYNPAHHHAMLQGLIWKQSNGLEAPRPCCAPSKLVELEVLHVDEKNSEKLKISTWTNMRVVECACS